MFLRAWDLNFELQNYYVMHILFKNSAVSELVCQFPSDFIEHFFHDIIKSQKY